MEYSHKLARSTTDTLEKLVAFIEERRRSDSLSADVAEFEKDVRALCSAVERAATTEELARFDVHAPAVRVDGVVHRFVLRSECEYLTSAGPVRVDLEPDPFDDATQYTVQLEAVWTKFPWDHKVRTRLSVAEGLSYVDKIPYVEQVRHIRRINAPETAQFLSYMTLKLGVNLYDVLKPISSSPRLNDCFGGARIAHRSGAWGIFAGVYGASNYPGLFVECSFGRKK